MHESFLSYMYILIDINCCQWYLISQLNCVLKSTWANQLSYTVPPLVTTYTCCRSWDGLRNLHFLSTTGTVPACTLCNFKIFFGGLWLSEKFIYFRKADLWKGIWNPKRKVGVKNSHTLFSILNLSGIIIIQKSVAETKTGTQDRRTSDLKQRPTDLKWRPSDLYFIFITRAFYENYWRILLVA